MTLKKSELRRALFGGSVLSALEMMLHLADESAREGREKFLSRGRNGIYKDEGVTPAMLEKQEWNAFVSKLTRRAELLRLPPERVEEAIYSDESGAAAIDVDEDDIDILLALVGVLDAASDAKRMLTITEVVRDLQATKVLSREFPAAARDQTKRLLLKLRAMNRAWVDDAGRWALL